MGRAMSGAAWAGATQFLSKGSTVVATLVLARLLAPDDFGLFAIGMLVVNYVDRIKDLGISAALVYRTEPWTVLSGTGLTLSVASCGVLAGLTAAGAPVAASFFDDQRATQLLQVLAVVLLLTGLSIVPEAKMRRELDFRRRSIPETAVALVKGVVAVALAAVGLGAWSLVWGQIAGVLAQAVLYWSLVDLRPRFGWDPVLVRAMLAYGIPISLVAVFAAVQENLDYLVIGNRLDTRQLGYYTMAFRIPELTVMGICIVASTVLFPLLSRMQGDPDALSSNYLRAVRYITCLTVPVGALIAVLAAEVVEVAYGAEWRPIIGVLRWLAVFAVVYSLGFHAGDVYKATGRPGILNWFALVKIALLGPALWLLVQWGISGVAIGMVAAHVVIGVAELVVAQRILRFDPRRLVTALTPGIVGGLALTAVSLLVRWPLEGAPPLVRLVVVGLVGTATFALVTRFLGRDVYDTAAGFVARLVPRRIRSAR